MPPQLNPQLLAQLSALLSPGGNGNGMGQSVRPPSQQPSKDNITQMQYNPTDTMPYLPQSNSQLPNSGMGQGMQQIGGALNGALQNYNSNNQMPLGMMPPNGMGQGMQQQMPGNMPPQNLLPGVMYNTSYMNNQMPPNMTPQNGVGQGAPNQMQNQINPNFNPMMINGMFGGGY